jgi:hypothetical protein
MFKIEGKTKRNFRVNLSKKTVVLPILNIDERIKDDPELWYGFKSNIAMAFVDCAYWYRRKNKKKYLSAWDLHQISNEAAENFLKLWTRD